MFSTCPDRVAAPEIQVAFEEQVAASTIPTQIGDIKVSDLPGPEALLNPGGYSCYHNSNIYELNILPVVASEALLGP